MIGSNRDIKQRLEFMVGDRYRMENVWRDITALYYPAGPRWEDMESRGGRTMDPIWQEARTARRGRRMYDSTAVSSSERLAAGVESMITPQAQQWHTLSLEGIDSFEPTIDEEAWIDRIVNYMFSVRYDPRSGFLSSHQNAIYSAVTLGTGVVFVEENFGAQDASAAEIPYRYIPIPLNETFLQVSSHGVHDTCFRVFKLSARQAAERFGAENLSHKLQAKFDKPDQMDDRYDFIQAVFPSEELNSDWRNRTDLPFTSIYQEHESNHEISFSGYKEFPYIVYTWNLVENSPYGESPSMQCLPEAKSLQLMARDALLASQANIRPPMASAYSLDRPLNMNPGAINPKFVDPQSGRLLAQPLISKTDPSLFETTMEMRRNQIRETMYTNLFQVMADKQYMTATEASIRNSEKAELLGPAATRIQVALAAYIEREMGILERKGAFRPDAAFEPPESLQDQPINVKFTSPIDRARRISEVTGMQQTLEFAGGIAQFDPTVIDNFEFDEMVHVARQLFGAPAKTIKSPEHVKALREERAPAAGMQQAVEQAGAAGEAAQSAGAGIDPAALTGVPGASP